MTQKIGRNDPCFCGSGQKYKWCCNFEKKISIQPLLTDLGFSQLQALDESGIIDKEKPYYLGFQMQTNSNQIPSESYLKKWIDEKLKKFPKRLVAREKVFQLVDEPGNVLLSKFIELETGKFIVNLRAIYILQKADS
jgi:hypothetical protein